VCVCVCVCVRACVRVYAILRLYVHVCMYYVYSCVSQVSNEMLFLECVYVCMLPCAYE
jgi:hypothetical protein